MAGELTTPKGPWDPENLRLIPEEGDAIGSNRFAATQLRTVAQWLLLNAWEPHPRVWAKAGELADEIVHPGGPDS